MASSTFAGNGVAERRLRPIYDWLDSGNNKRAVQEADKVLKKQANFQCAKVLKALALLRLGKDEECEQLLDNVRTDIPVEDSTLQAMTICYKEMNKLEQVCEVYEAAVKKNPTNEELLTHLFMSYVRVGDYKKQQQAAMNLYKVKPKNPYYFWAVMSIVMQAYNRDDDQLSKLVVLPLAERMVKKFVADGKIECEQEVQLYLMILELQGKFKEALEVIDSPLGETLVSYAHVPYKRGCLLAELKLWEECNICFKNLLRKDMDNWEYYQKYFMTCWKLCDNEIECKDAEADNTPIKCWSFLQNLIEDSKSSSRKIRGPLLAQLEFFSLLHKRKEDPALLLGADVLSVFEVYFNEFGDKPCCVSDLKPYLYLLTGTEREKFKEPLLKLIEKRNDEFPENTKELQQHITVLQLYRCLGCHIELSSEEKVAQTAYLLKHFQNTLKFNEGLLPTEFSFSDTYALLAAYLLYDIWIQTENTQFLIEAITFLEYALTHSPSNFYIKLSLIKLYNCLGAGGASQGVYELLDVKHVQLDTLGYYHCSNIFLTGQFTAAALLYDSTLKFFTASYRDAVDHLAFAYKYGSFHKVEEFIQFRERLNNSLHYACITVEKMLLDIINCASFMQTVGTISEMDISPDVDKIQWEGLRDNRDLNVLVSWEPVSRRVTPEIKHKIFEDDIQYLKLRNLILRCIAASVNLSADCNIKNKNYCENNSNQIQSVTGHDEHGMYFRTFCTLHDELVNLFESLQENSSVSHSLHTLNSPPLSCLHGFLASSTCPVFLEFLSVIKLFVLNSDENEVLDGKISKVVGIITAAMHTIKNRLDSLSITESNKLFERKSLLEYIVHIIEMISFVTIFCGVLVRMSSKAVSTTKKGKKKSIYTINSLHLERLEVLKKMVATLCNFTEELDQLLSGWESEEDSLVNLNILNSVNVSTVADTVTAKFRCSHKSSLGELRRLVQMKQKFLSSLKL